MTEDLYFTSVNTIKYTDNHHDGLVWCGCGVKLPTGIASTDLQLFSSHVSKEILLKADTANDGKSVVDFLTIISDSL